MSTTTSHLHDTVAFAPPSDDEIERGDEPRPQLQIIQRVQAAIRLGEYAPKALLPMRDDFMREFSVSRVTVQRAFNRLIADGFVTTRGSQGTYVAPRPPNVFRIGLVFDESKADALRDKYRMSVLSAAAHWDESAAFTIAPYYGMAEYRAGGDKDQIGRAHV